MSTLSHSHVMPTYSNLPIFLSHGQGVWVWDEAGRKYLDGLAGIAVNTLGHNHPDDLRVASQWVVAHRIQH